MVDRLWANYNPGYTLFHFLFFILFLLFSKPIVLGRDFFLMQFVLKMFPAMTGGR